MRTVILHIGHPKTGTSSIQHAIAGYDDGSTFTATFGGMYPSLSNEIHTAFSSEFLNFFVWKARGYDETKIRRIRERFRAKFSAILARRDRTRIIVSAESIWGLSDTDQAELVEFINRHDWDVRVIAYVREPLSWANSRISQFTKSGKPLEFSAWKNLNYRNRLSTFIKLLPPERLHVRRYDRSTLIGNNVVTDFAEIVGLDLPRDIPRMNESLPLPALKLLIRFNRSGILTHGANDIYKVRGWLVQKIEETYAGSKRLDSFLCSGIVDWSQVDWLYETFGIDFRPKASHPETSAADLEAFLTDLSDVDLSGLDNLLAEYGVRHENFTTAEEKLHRLFYALMMESAGRDWRLQWSDVLFRIPGKNRIKKLLSPTRRKRLMRTAVSLCERWAGTNAKTQPEKRTAILHIGQHKTGSSSIQSALEGYDDGSTFTATFQELNHSMPITTAFSSEFLNYHFWKSSGLSETKVRQKRERYRTEFSTMLTRRDRDRIIVSGEDIEMLSDADKAGLVEFIRQHGWEVQVIAYVREPISLTASKISQRIKATRGLAQIIPNEILPIYKKALSYFARILPPEHLHVQIYDREKLAGGNVIEDFCQTLDLDLPRDIPRKNKSPSLPALKLLFRFNRSGILFKKDPKLHAARGRLMGIVVNTYSEGEKLSPSLCAGIVDWSDTDWLYETFGIDFRPKTSLLEKSPETSAAELEAFLTDLSDVDLSGLDNLLAEYGVRHENFTTADEKLHRLYYALLMESARRNWRLMLRGVLSRIPGMYLAKIMLYRVLKRLRSTTPARETAV